MRFSHCENNVSSDSSFAKFSVFEENYATNREKSSKICDTQKMYRISGKSKKPDNRKGQILDIEAEYPAGFLSTVFSVSIANYCCPMLDIWPNTGQSLQYAGSSLLYPVSAAGCRISKRPDYLDGYSAKKRQKTGILGPAF